MATLHIFPYHRYVLICSGAVDAAGGFLAQLSVRHQNEFTLTSVPLGSYSFPTEYDAVECAHARGMEWVRKCEQASG